MKLSKIIMDETLLLLVANGMFFIGTEQFNDNWMNWATTVGMMVFYDFLVIGRAKK